MSASAASVHARRAQQQRTAEEKLDEIAKALDYLARAVADIENDVARIKNR